MSNYRRSLVVLFLALLNLIPISEAKAQEEPVQDFAMWSAIFTTVNLNAKAPGPALWLDLHSRRGEGVTMEIVRPGVGYIFTPWLSVWGGYAWVPTFKDNPQSYSAENRIWEQVILSHTVGGQLALQSRSRFEQRFSTEGSGVGNRFREFVRAGWLPLGSPVGLVLWDEIFFGFNDTDWGAVAGYDQNRLFLGGMIPIDDWARVEAGYLMVHLNRDPQQLVSAIAFNLYIFPKWPVLD